MKSKLYLLNLLPLIIILICFSQCSKKPQTAVTIRDNTFIPSPTVTPAQKPGPTTPAPKQPTTAPQRVSRAITTPSMKTPSMKRKEVMPNAGSNLPDNVAPGAASGETRISSNLPMLHGGDKIALPKGYGVFTVPLGMNARVTSPGPGLITKQCGDPIVPPCRMEWPIPGGVMRIELEPAKDEHPQSISTSDSQGLRSHVYFGGETVAGFYVEPGYFLIVPQGKPPIYAECMKLAPCPECGPRVTTKFVSDPSCREDRVRFNR